MSGALATQLRAAGARRPPTPPGIGGWDDLRTSAHAWHVCPDALSPAALEERRLAWLTPQERACREQRRTGFLQHEYLVARVLCRAALSRYTGVDPAVWRFARNAHGKPAIASPVCFQQLRFNLSGTAGLVVCLVTRAGEVGIDAEETSCEVDIDQIARHFFSPEECAFLARRPQSRNASFYEQWVLKEAYLKGIGTGLWRSPEQVTIQRDPLGRPLPLGKWQIALHHPTPHHIAATAIEPSDCADSIPVLWHDAESLRLDGAEHCRRCDEPPVAAPKLTM